MGLILDSSIVIAAERRGHTVRRILDQLNDDIPKGILAAVLKQVGITL